MLFPPHPLLFLVINCHIISHLSSTEGFSSQLIHPPLPNRCLKHSVPSTQFQDLCLAHLSRITQWPHHLLRHARRCAPSTSAGIPSRPIGTVPPAFRLFVMLSKPPVFTHIPPVLVGKVRRNGTMCIDFPNILGRLVVTSSLTGVMSRDMKDPSLLCR